MKCPIVLACTAFVLLGAAGSLFGEPPAQFRVWGTAGPQFRSLPEGWTEAAAPVRVLEGLTPTADEERRGFLISAPDPFTVVESRAVPLPFERTESLQVFAGRGQYEPVSFALHAIRDLNDVLVEASELRSPAGDAIPADHVDVRHVRGIRVPVTGKAKTFRWEPFLLEKRKAIPIAKGTAQRVWLTLKVPEEAPAGDYAGTVSIRAGGREAAQVKLVVQVLPFALPPAPIEVAMFYPNPPDSGAMLMRQLVDLREHGCNGVEPAMGVVIKSRDRMFGDDDIAATRAQCKRLMDAELKVFGPRRFPVTFEVGHQIAYYWDQQKNWFAFWPRSKKIDDDFLRAIDVVRDLAKQEGWPPLRAYAQDEAGAHNLLEEAIHLYSLLKKHDPGLITWTDVGGGMAMGIDEIGPLDPYIDVFNTNRFTPEIAKALVARKKPYAIYNGCGPWTAGPRFFFGFYGYKTGAMQIAQWAYHAGNAVFQGNGLRQEDEGYVCLADDGPLPSVMWESVREGIDDYRYLDLLARTIAAARASSKPEAKQAAAAAQRALDGLLGRVGWGFQALDSADRTPPPHPATLRKWRRQVAQQIVALQAVIGQAKELPPPALVSPLELPWAERAKKESQYGAELLPPSGFETAMKPWRIEAWNGKGQGRLDPTASHGGMQSVRIDVPATSGSQAVTVLVWPTWGDGGLKLSLEGGRRYELSGWMKWEGRSTAPSLRIALPDGAEKTTQSGQDAPLPSGWRRIWARSELNFPAVPKYLGVWVQGPGTVWIDDLSLRECIPAALEISADQDEYDGSDRAGFLSIVVKRQPPPAQVRCTLSRPGGETVTRLVASFEAETSFSAEGASRAGALLLAPAALGHCRFAFDPSRLPPGKHEVKVEILDSQGRVVASKTQDIVRVQD